MSVATTREGARSKQHWIRVPERECVHTGGSSRIAKTGTSPEAAESDSSGTSGMSMCTYEHCGSVSRLPTLSAAEKANAHSSRHRIA